MKDYTEEEKGLLKRTICRELDDDEFAMFLATCKRMGLDPFAKQIMPVKRYNKKAGAKVMTIQITIDGYRMVASRTGEYEGQDGPYWCGPDGKWGDVWVDDKSPPTAAKVGVMRKGFKQFLYGVAKFNEFAQRNRDNSLGQFWGSMGDIMIAKCAEAQAIRRGFPELAGTYIPEEMAGAVDSYVPEAKVSEPAGSTGGDGQWASSDVSSDTGGDFIPRTPHNDDEAPLDDLGSEYATAIESAASLAELTAIGKAMAGIDLGDSRQTLVKLYARRRKELAA